MERKGASFDEYLAGGFLANAPILFFTYVAKSLWSEEMPSLGLEIASVVTVALGGFMAGYLVVRRVNRDQLRIGLKTGLSAFLVNFAFSSIIFEGTTILYGLWILTVFCIASVSGALVRRSEAKSTSCRGRPLGSWLFSRCMEPRLCVAGKTSSRGLTQVGFIMSGASS